jgi:16S rRNA (uracil1498-N3)-methyltransferase
MPVNRFYLDADLKKGDLLLLEGSEHHHLSHVIQLKPSEKIELINGKGFLSVAEIIEVEKKKTHLKILSLEKKERSSPQLILSIPFMRPSKLEWVIEKGCELGADLFLLFKATYSEKAILSEHLLERLHNLLIAACKQSGRLYLPSIEILDGLEDVFKHKATFLFGDTKNAPSPKIPKDEVLGFITGPERGFSEEELKLLSNKALGVRLNQNILRAETAPIAAMSILAYPSRENTGQ